MQTRPSTKQLLLAGLTSKQILGQISHHLTSRKATLLETNVDDSRSIKVQRSAKKLRAQSNTKAKSQAAKQMFPKSYGSTKPPKTVDLKPANQTDRKIQFPDRNVQAGLFDIDKSIQSMKEDPKISKIGKDKHVGSLSKKAATGAPTRVVERVATDDIIEDLFANFQIGGDINPSDSNFNNFLDGELERIRKAFLNESPLT